MANPNRYYSAVAQDTTLSSSCTAGDLSIQVTSTTGWPTQYPFCLALDYAGALEELVDVTSLAGLTATITRAVDSTVAVGHTAGSVVRHVITARDIRDGEQHIANTTGVHGITGAVVGTTDVQVVTNKDFTSATNTLPAGTGTGALVRANNPTLVTPVLGVATATSINGVTIDNTAWTAYTPTVTAFSGTLTTVSATGRQKTIGKSCTVSGSVTITTVGSGSGGVNVSLPFAPHASSIVASACREYGVSSNMALIEKLAGSTAFAIYWTLVSGSAFSYSFTYEVA